MAAKKTTKTKKPATKRSSAKAAKARSGKNEALRLTSVSPSLTVNDVEKSLAWYCDVLGFTVDQRWESDGKLMGVEMKAGSVVFMIAQDDWKKGRDRVKGAGVRIYCDTDQDIDRLAARIKANGGTLAQEPKDQPWRMRDLAIDDPDGYKITIAKDLKKR
jgi:uncharacterized glyoxalase superfamily protein PhnB